MTFGLYNYILLDYVLLYYALLDYASLDYMLFDLLHYELYDYVLTGSVWLCIVYISAIWYYIRSLCHTTIDGYTAFHVVLVLYSYSETSN